MPALPLGYTLSLWQGSPESAQACPRDHLTGHTRHKMLFPKCHCLCCLHHFRACRCPRRRWEVFLPSFGVHLGIWSQGSVARAPGHLQPVCPSPRGVVSRKDWDLCLRCRAGHPTPAICSILAPLRLSLQQPAPLFQPNVLTYMSFHKRAHSHRTGPDADVFSPLGRPLGSPSTTTKVLHPALLPNPCF